MTETIQEKLRFETPDLKDANAFFKMGAAVGMCSDAADHIDKLEAEIKRLREALEYIAESHDAGRHDGKPEECPAHDDVFMWLMAREALAEGDADE